MQSQPSLLLATIRKSRGLPGASRDAEPGLMSLRSDRLRLGAPPEKIHRPRGDARHADKRSANFFLEIPVFIFPKEPSLGLPRQGRRSSLLLQARLRPLHSRWRSRKR